MTNLWRGTPRARAALLFLLAGVLAVVAALTGCASAGNSSGHSTGATSIPCGVHIGNSGGGGKLDGGRRNGGGGHGFSVRFIAAPQTRCTSTDSAAAPAGDNTATEDPIVVDSTPPPPPPVSPKQWAAQYATVIIDSLVSDTKALEVPKGTTYDQDTVDQMSAAADVLEADVSGASTLGMNDPKAQKLLNDAINGYSGGVDEYQSLIFDVGPPPTSDQSTVDSDYVNAMADFRGGYNSLQQLVTYLASIGISVRSVL